MSRRTSGKRENPSIWATRIFVDGHAQIQTTTWMKKSTWPLQSVSSCVYKSFTIGCKLMLLWCGCPQTMALLDDTKKAEIETFDSKLTSLVPLQVQFYARQVCSHVQLAILSHRYRFRRCAIERNYTSAVPLKCMPFSWCRCHTEMQQSI